MSYKPYNPSENFYARFAFEYTSRARLVKWGLCDEMGVPVQRKGSAEHKEGKSGMFVMTEEEDGKGKEVEKGRRKVGEGEDPGQEDTTMKVVPATDNTDTIAKAKRNKKGAPRSGKRALHCEVAEEKPAKSIYLDPNRTPSKAASLGGNGRATLRPRK
jgi:hypothetical protein